MRKNFICVLLTFTFETAKWITLYINREVLFPTCAIYKSVPQHWYKVVVIS